MKEKLRPSLKSLVIICSLLFGFSCNQKSPNLVQNPGFETGKGENPDGWFVEESLNAKGFEVGTDESEFHSGER